MGKQEVNVLINVIFQVFKKCVGSYYKVFKIRLLLLSVVDMWKGMGGEENGERVKKGVEERGGEVEKI